MTDTAEVRIWGEKVGVVSWDKTRKFGSFEFYPDFPKNNWDLSPIHMSILNSKDRIFSFPNLNETTYKGLPGLLSDSLPDDFGNRVIDQWLAVNSINKSNFTPVDRLCYIGERGMGALEFHPSIKNTIDKRSTPIEVDKLVEFASIVLNRRQKFETALKDEEGLKELIKVGSSAGGQRPKAIIAYNKQTKQVKSGQVLAPSGFEHMIIKLDGVTNKKLGDPLGFGRIEYAYYLMALDCGIEITQSTLFEEGGRAHFMTKRFDRRGNAEKLHMQSLCAMAHYDYKISGAYSYENAFEIMRQLKLPHPQLEQLFRRMVFNIVARNQDDHTKNITFLMDKSGEWELSPAYDITYSYNPTGIWTNQHQMSVNGKRDNFTKRDIVTVGEKMSLKKSEEILDEIIERVSNWISYSTTAGVPIKQARMLKKAFRLNLQ